jgi:uncharacterized protein (DUF1330 family)
MPAYLIVIREEPLKNPAEYEEYQRVAAQNRGDIPLKPVAMLGAVAGLEGPTPDAVVMLEFASVEEAKAWYDSPGYQAALPHRLAAAPYRTFIFEGV